MKDFYTVVVADDEDEIRESVCEMVPWEELGFKLVGAGANGLDALQLVEELSPDLLLTDIRMPFISGLELARQVRDIRPATNIAFLSGHDDFAYAKEAIQYNILSYLLKPITNEDLSKELANIKQKIDRQMDSFRQLSAEEAGKDTTLMSLVLDDEPMEGAELEEALDELDFPRGESIRYTVMMTCFFDESDNNSTRAEQVSSIRTVADKYLLSRSFFYKGRIVTLLAGKEADMGRYLSILADEVVELSARALGSRCIIGFGRTVDQASEFHGVYKEAITAVSSTDAEQSIRYISDLSSSKPGGELLCAQALEYIDKHFAEESLSLVTVSNELHVSPNYLSASISRYGGQTFINTLIERRMKHAKQLLITTSGKIMDVAEACGYTDQHYFSYCYKKYWGITPNAQRKGEAENKE